MVHFTALRLVVPWIVEPSCWPAPTAIGHSSDSSPASGQAHVGRMTGVMSQSAAQRCSSRATMHRCRWRLAPGGQELPTGGAERPHGRKSARYIVHLSRNAKWGAHFALFTRCSPPFPGIFVFSGYEGTLVSRTGEFPARCAEDGAREEKETRAE
jgi:hypothetical protein